MTAKVDDDFFELGDPENIVINVGISCLSFKQLEIQGTSGLAAIFTYGKEFNLRSHSFVSAEFLR